MEYFNARAELATRRSDRDDDLIDALEGFSAAVSRSPRGWVEVIITVPADTLRQAIATSLALFEQAGDTGIVALEVMSTAEFDARLGFVPVPELIGATDASVLLGVSRQRVLQMIDEGKLPGTLIGKSRVIPRAAVAQLAARQHTDTTGPAAAP